MLFKVVALTRCHAAPRGLSLGVVIALVGLSLFAGCTRAAGRLQVASLASKAEGRVLRYAVYLPPGWDFKTPLPLVVLLHGAGDDERTPDRVDVVRAFDAAITRGTLPPFVLVAPEGDFGFWVNWYDGTHHYKDWVLDEVVPAVRARFPLIPGRAGLHLVGVSMGAGGGLQMWLSAPDAFASVAALSAPILNERDTRAFLRHFTSEQVIGRVFGPSGGGTGRDPYKVLQSAHDLHGTKLLFGAAMHDRRGILDATGAFHRTLAARKVPHQFVVFEGRHAWKSWAQVFPFVLCQQLRPHCDLPAPPGARVQEIPGSRAP